MAEMNDLKLMLSNVNLMKIKSVSMEESLSLQYYGNLFLIVDSQSLLTEVVHISTGGTKQHFYRIAACSNNIRL